MSATLQSVVAEMDAEGSLAYEAAKKIGIFAYTVVGSCAYLPDHADAGDVDVVLLAHGDQASESALPRLLQAFHTDTFERKKLSVYPTESKAERNEYLPRVVF